MKQRRLNLGVSKAADRRILASVSRVCDSCGDTFALPREFTGTHGEWTCSSCLDKASAAFAREFNLES